MNAKKVISALSGIAACAALTWFYAVEYRGHLLWQEQNQIFLNDSGWIKSQLHDPEDIVLIAGGWLTQFFIHPWIGALILTTLIAVSTWLFFRVARRMLKPLVAAILTALFASYLIGCSLSSKMAVAFFLGIVIMLPAALIRVTLRVGKKKYRLSWIAPVIAFFLFVEPTLVSPTLPQMQHERMLQIAEAYSEGNLPQAKQLALRYAGVGDVAAFYYYLSSAVQDSLPDNLLKYPHRNLGTLTTIGEKTPLPVINVMNDLYFELGDMTYAERAAMMRCVFSPQNRNVRMLRRLAEVNLVSGDTLAARKYLGLLSRTFAYSDWSRRHTPGKMSPSAEREILKRRRNANAKDNIRLGDNCRNIILELLESNPHNTVALDYLLCTDLLLKDMDTFKMDYDAYCMEKGSPRYKDLYQQALMIYLAGSEAPQEEWDRYIASPYQLKDFQAYGNRRGNPAFKGTYWYYFDRE